jgi:hypothetical protein
MHAGGKGRKEKRQDLPGRRRTIYPGPTIAMDWSPPSRPQSLPTRHGQWASILTVPTVRKNCSGRCPLPSGATSGTSFFRSHACVDPLEINKNGTENRLADGTGAGLQLQMVSGRYDLHQRFVLHVRCLGVFPERNVPSPDFARCVHV